MTIATKKTRTRREIPATFDRGKFLWEFAKKRRDETVMQGKVFQGLNRLEKIRKAENVFGSSAEVYTYDVHNDAVLCIMRRTEKDVFFGIFNFGSRDETAWMKEEGTFVDLLTGRKMTVENITVPKHGFYWLRSDR